LNPRPAICPRKLLRA